MLRDLVHQFRYGIEQTNGQLTAESVPMAEEGIDLYRTHFIDVVDMMSGDALQYATVLMQALGRGIEVNIPQNHSEQAGDYGDLPGNREFAGPGGESRGSGTALAGPGRQRMGPLGGGLPLARSAS